MLLVYGKLVIDSIRLISGARVDNLLGGGGPQSVLGARLFTTSVGFLTRSGTDLEPGHLDTLQGLGADVQGWHQFPHLQTPRLAFQYDQDQIMLEHGTQRISVVRQDKAWNDLLAQDLTWPVAYEKAKGVHLVSEFSQETMVHQALSLKAKTGALLSLEPLVDVNTRSNVEAMKSLIPQVDVVCPDLEAALLLCQTGNPLTAARALHDMGPRYVVIRAGSQGSFVAGHATPQTIQVPPLPVTVVDPTGAGNAFSGGLAASLLEGFSLMEAACNATAAACAVLEVAGLPRYSEELARQVRRRARQLFLGLQA